MVIKSEIQVFTKRGWKKLTPNARLTSAVTNDGMQYEFNRILNPFNASMWVRVYSRKIVKNKKPTRWSKVDEFTLDSGKDDLINKLTVRTQGEGGALAAAARVFIIKEIDDKELTQKEGKKTGKSK